MHYTFRAILAPALVCASITQVWAGNGALSVEADGDHVDNITVYGRKFELIGSAQAASEGVVGYDDFKDRPFSRAGELVEVIPGVVATQHSGEGKANQYFLRGFNLDHGTDFSVAVDGAPVNLRSHGHGQGYLDLNFIIPEIIERVDFRKGPYRASTGDFSAAGSARYTTNDYLDRDFIELSVGQFGFLRGVLAVDHQLTSSVNLLTALEVKRYDGPFELEQNLEKINALVKLVYEDGPWAGEASFRAYDSEWTATEQVPLRAIESGLIDRFGFIDDDLGGNTSRFSFNGDISYVHASGAETQASVYAVAYDFQLFSNFTYFLNDPINGDEFEQIDERTYLGGSLTHHREIGDRLLLRAGGDLRYDDIRDVGLFQTAARERLSTVRRDTIGQFSASAWAEAEFRLTDTLRATLGARGDYFTVDVEGFSEPRNGGERRDGLFSPSIGLAWRASDRLELYANYGRGFHSNDARGTTATLDPLTDEAIDPVPLLVKADGVELGARYEEGPLRLSLAAFYLDLDSELVFVGDAGNTEVNGATRRFGLESSLFWNPVHWFAADISAAWTDAEFSNPIDAGGPEIPNAVPLVVGGGFVAHVEAFTLSARLRHFGAAPLVEDGAARSQSTTIVNLAASRDWGPTTLTLELLNVFDAEDAEITYFFESQLAGEPAPVADFHFRPVEPRQIRGTVRYNF